MIKRLAASDPRRFPVTLIATVKSLTAYITIVTPVYVILFDWQHW